MGRRMSKKENEAVGFLIVIGLLVGAVVWVFERIGFVIPSLIVLVGIGIYFYNKKQQEKERLRLEQDRKNYLINKYGDEELVAKIMRETVWQGQTDGQLADSLGNPEDIDQKVLKTKKKEIWKYYHQGGNRYGLRITLDNDVVVGWDEKM